jgi:hypothetical protein
MTESALTNRIVVNLRRRGIYVRKIAGSAYQHSGLPDLWIVYNGRLIACEVKLPREHGGRDATPLQKREIDMLRNAGATAAVVRSWEDVERLIGFNKEGTAMSDTKTRSPQEWATWLHRNRQSEEWTVPPAIAGEIADAIDQLLAERDRLREAVRFLLDGLDNYWITLPGNQERINEAQAALLKGAEHE